MEFSLVVAASLRSDTKEEVKKKASLRIPDEAVEICPWRNTKRGERYALSPQGVVSMKFSTFHPTTALQRFGLGCGVG